jgi:hypothetical protein
LHEKEHKELKKQANLNFTSPDSVKLKNFLRLKWNKFENPIFCNENIIWKPQLKQNLFIGNLSLFPSWALFE